MENLTSAISVQVDAYDKEVANGILKNLGLNMSAFVNMAIKQLINKDGIPFEVCNPKPSKLLINSLEEGDKIIEEINKGIKKGYSNVQDLFDSLDED